VPKFAAEVWELDHKFAKSKRVLRNMVRKGFFILAIDRVFGLELQHFFDEKVHVGKTCKVLAVEFLLGVRVK
jgi:hypothetical protein